MRPTRSSVRWHRRGALGVGGILALFLSVFVFSPNAFAHHSEISGKVDCDGVVSWTAVAWNGTTEASRTNPNVDVWYKIGSGPAVPVANGAFNKANNFSFSGTFNWPDPNANELTLWTQAKSNWANGASPGDAYSYKVTLPTDCPGPTITVSATCTTVTVTSTKDLSNIIWQAQDGSEDKFDNLTGTTYTFANDPSNPIVAVWVKSGNNKVSDSDPHPTGNWGDGVGEYHLVPVPTDCGGTPSVSSAVACVDGDGNVTITLGNTGGYLPVSYVVTDPRDNSTQNVTVDVGKTKQVVLTGFADGDYTIPVTVGDTHYDQKVTVNCDRPGVPKIDLSQICVDGDGQVTLTLKNTGGDLPVTFVVTNPVNQAKTTKVVAPGGSATVVLGSLPDGDHTIPVTADGKSMDQKVTVNCDRPGVPKIDLSQICVEGDGQVTVKLSNTGGDLPVTFVVTNPVNQAKTTKVVPVGSSATVVLGSLPDGTQTIGITADGQNMDQTVVVNCDRPGVPSVSVDEVCSDFDGQVTVTLKNTGGDLPITFVVKDPVNGTPTQKVVPVGGTATVTYSGLADGDYVVPVTADGKSMDQKVSVNCDRPGEPQTGAQVECTATGGEVTVTLTNASPAGEAEPITFVVGDPVLSGSPAGGTQTVVVPAGSSKTIVTGSLPDGDYTVSVKADGTELDPIAFTVDCQQPEVSGVVDECADGGVLIGLGNTGGSPVTLTVYKNGELVGTVDVPAEGKVEYLVPVNEDETATITVNDGDTVVDELTLTRNCEEPPTTETTTPATTAPAPPATNEVTQTEVLGKVQTEPLPRTGSESRTLALYGIGLVLIGAGLILFSRRNHFG